MSLEIEKIGRFKIKFDRETYDYSPVVQVLAKGLTREIVEHETGGPDVRIETAVAKARFWAQANSEEL
jgi:hypothetical protein